MEMRAVYEVLQAIPDRPLLIEADSRYVIDVFTQWLPGWIKNGWRTSGRKPVANREAIEATASLLEGRDVIWEHVYGHRGHALNEVVDRRARAAAEAVKAGKPVETASRRTLSNYLDALEGEPT